MAPCLKVLSVIGDDTMLIHVMARIAQFGNPRKKLSKPIEHGEESSVEWMKGGPEGRNQRMGYEVFSRKTSRVGTPTVTFTSLGRVALNKHATRVLEKDAVEFVILLWDNEGRRIGIRPITKRDQRAYRVSYGKNGNGAGFSAKTFLDYINYNYAMTMNFPIEWNDKEGMFEAQIPAAHFKDNRQAKLLPLDTPGSRESA